MKTDQELIAALEKATPEQVKRLAAVLAGVLSGKPPPSDKPKAKRRKRP